MIIREETVNDHNEVYELITEAFATEDAKMISGAFTYAKEFGM